MTYRKKLIEVSLPLEAINKESAREKSIRKGHISTLHLYWARRPHAYLPFATSVCGLATFLHGTNSAISYPPRILLVLLELM